MLILQIGLTIAAWRKGWRQRALLPLGTALLVGFLAGAVLGASGGSAEAATPLAVLVDLGVIAALAVMASRAPVAQVQSSPAPAPEATRAVNQPAV